MNERPKDADSLELAVAAMRRGDDSHELARSAFRRVYPEAAEKMIDLAVFHLYVDGIAAAREWLADLERFLRDPSHEISYGDSSHLLYHLYNWHVLETLMPHGKQRILDWVDDIQSFANNGDLDAIKKSVGHLKDELLSNQAPPRLSDC